jgi:hypothetical protein
MRWFKKQSGDRRIVQKFLWFPLTIDNETRWLEFARFEQEIKSTFIVSSELLAFPTKITSYINIRWIN